MCTRERERERAYKREKQTGRQTETDRERERERGGGLIYFKTIEFSLSLVFSGKCLSTSLLLSPFMQTQIYGHRSFSYTGPTVSTVSSNTLPL